MLVMLLDQRFHRCLWNRYQADGVFRLGAGELQGAIRVSDILLADRDGLTLDVHVIPPQGRQFTFSQAADQFQIEHEKASSGLGSLQIGVHIFSGQNLHLYFWGLRGNTVLGGISGDEPLLDRQFQGCMEHQTDAMNRCGAKSLYLCLSKSF